MKEGTEYDSDEIGENNPQWEPPCIAEDEDVPDGDGISVKVADELPNEVYESDYNALNETMLTSEQYEELLKIEATSQT